MTAWETCLITGVSWDTYWTLTSREINALAEAHGRVARQRQRNTRR